MSSHSALAVIPSDRFARARGIWDVVRACERAASLLILLAIFPLMVLAAIAIFVLSRQSPLVAHLRVGQFGIPFWTLKLRTMWPSGSPPMRRVRFIEYIVDESGMESKRAGDPRVTSRFARFCRRFSIDELPQLLNVVRGEMCLVAPRPLTEGELKMHYQLDAMEVLLEKPGITGLWQVMGRSRLTYGQRRRLDLFLVRNRSLRLYFTILLRTMPVVLRGSDGW